MQTGHSLRVIQPKLLLQQAVGVPTDATGHAAEGVRLVIYARALDVVLVKGAVHPDPAMARRDSHVRKH